MACPSTSCAQILADGFSTGDGLYYIDPNASGSPYQVYCDMTTDSGGWTLIANISDDGDDVWSEFMPASDAGLWDSTDTLGTYSITADYKSQVLYGCRRNRHINQRRRYECSLCNSCFTEQSFQRLFLV